MESAVLTAAFSGSSDLEGDEDAEAKMRAISMRWAVDMAELIGGQVRGEIQYEIEVDDEDRVWTVRCKTLVVRETLDAPRD